MVSKLALFWEKIPPAVLQLKRIAGALGIADSKPRVQTSKQSLQEVMHECSSAGLAVHQGRPDDPMLDLIGL